VVEAPKIIMGKVMEKKYAPHIDETHLIKMKDQIPSSNIWNATWRNRPLIQEHALWELRDRQDAFFWSESWKQIPPLQSLEILHQLPSPNAK
jgi:hypothetical protein